MSFLFEINHISKDFKTSNGKYIPILSDINFKLPYKGLFFIYGKSGTGKTTLLNLLENLLKPSSGEILYKNKNIFSYKEKDVNNYLKNEIGIVFQSFNLINDASVEENLNICKEIKGIKNFEYKPLFKEFNLNINCNQNVSKLSGGEKQRVAIIRSLINNPSVIFADEPTGNLDKENSIKIMEIFRKLSKDRLIVVVTHNNKLIEEYNDGYLYIENGKVKRYKEIENNESEIKKVKYKRSKYKTYLKNNLKKNKVINFLTIFSICFSLLSSFFIGSVFLGSKNTDSLMYNYEDYNCFKISKILDSEITNSNLKLLKVECPNDDDIDNLINNDTELHIDPYYFLKNSTTRIEGKNITNFEYVPTNTILDNSLYVNDAFISLCNKYQINDVLNESLYCYSRCTYQNRISNGDESIIVKEHLNVDFNFKIRKINKEFPFLKTPKVYYSIYYVEDLLQSKYCSNNVSYYDLLNNANNDDEIKNYSKLIFINEDSFLDVKEIINDVDNYMISNNAIKICDSFEELNESLFYGLILFLIIILSISVILVSFMSFVSFSLNRKESALLSILGLNSAKIMDIYISNKILFSILSIFISIFLFKIISYVLNIYTYNAYSFPNLFYDFLEIKNIVFVFIITIIFVAISVYIPLSLSKKIDYCKELKEE